MGVAPPLQLEALEEGGEEKLGLHLNGIEEHTDNKGAEPIENLELYVGLSLVIGFVFMLLIDQLSPAHSHGESGMPQV